MISLMLECMNIILLNLFHPVYLLQCQYCTLFCVEKKEMVNFKFSQQIRN